MATVTIEGSLSPSAELPRGERRKVQRSEHVDRLIRKGFVVVVDEDGDVVPTPEPTGPEAPAKNASTDAWRDFLTAQSVEFDPDATRDELVDAWDAHTAV